MAVAAGYRYRFDPTPEQADLLRRTFGCVRAVYNRALHERAAAWRERRERVSFKVMSRWLPVWKAEWPWLAQVSSVPVEQALRHLEAGYARLFQRLGRKPRFKSRRDRQSATFMKTAFRWRDGQLTLALMKQSLAIRWSRALPSTPSSVTISRDAAGRWHVAFRVAVEPPPAPEPLRPALGIDLGLMTLAASSDGGSVANPRWLRQRQHRLRRAQRALARKKKGSNNREKARAAVARLHARVADALHDHHHKLSTRWIRENQAIHVETLSLRGLARTRLARSLHDAAWGSLLAMLQYKAAWYRRDLVAIDRFFPSTRACSACGVVGPKRALHVRTWTCDGCGVTHDRDANASQNILAAGHAVRAGSDPRRWPAEGTSDAPGSARRAAPMKQEPVA
ncbi:putative transposase [Methylobacterium brachiatum]|uniref:Transposase n=1 Tax=Methylobacterium brachiatum TaxID=269660 RepID=A0AAJ1TT38_9HYPH|nr:transposase [Methylobacterium brachiatum]MCB4806445.1 transposase [Methylobacterium brachiatum]MDQ0546661.1 putative transposase [Methylobacterium brachiatum]